MSLNIINETDIKTLSKTLIDIIKEEEKASLKDMKMYLNKTNLSAEQKLKEYSNFSASLFNAKITAGITAAQQYIFEDKRLLQQKAVNDAQIELTETQNKVAIQEELIAKERISFTKEQTNQVKEEIKSLQTKNYLMIAETKTKLDNTVASTLSEARKSGAQIVSTNRSYTDPTTNQEISYQHISLSAASASDTTAGLIGCQMEQMKQQAQSFKDHSKVQVANQLMQLGSSAIAEGLTSIGGILSTHKTLCENIVGTDVFSNNYISIG